MNLQKLFYRGKIGGLQWILKTGIGCVRTALKPKALAKAPFSLGSRSESVAKVLYIHSGWAIETVGRLWFGNQDIVNVTFVRDGDPILTAAYFDRFDYVWYGYWNLFNSHPCDPSKAIVAVHDPSELFTQKADWKIDCHLSDEIIRTFRSFFEVIVISEEMERVMYLSDIPVSRIPTTSAIPIRNTSSVPTRCAPKVLSVGRIYPRKNFERFNRVSKSSKNYGIMSSFYLKSDHYPISESDYIELLDEHPIYLCTSFQEGGPLPAMDAMRRGAVVISSPVGQLTEIVEHGVNGYICHTDEEIIESIASLEKNPDFLHEMRLKSIESIQSKRSREVIGNAVSRILNRLNDNCHRR